MEAGYPMAKKRKSADVGSERSDFFSKRGLRSVPEAGLSSKKAQVGKKAAGNSALEGTRYNIGQCR
jgi:hypothetical protein